MSKRGYVFVYGTLKVGGHFAERFDNFRLSSISASTPGTMFVASGWFPGCVFGGENTIIGELHEYDDIERVMAGLDRIEGCYGEGHPGNLYNRKKVLVITEDGKEVEANTYEFAQNTDVLETMDSGIWPIEMEKGA